MTRISVVLGLLLIPIMAIGAEKPRVFIGDSDSWQMTGGGAGARGAGGGAVRGGARPQRVEIMKTFSKQCPQTIITIREEKADFIVFLEHEGGKGAFRKDNKVAVFNQEGDMLFANSTRSLGNSVKDACGVITANR